MFRNTALAAAAIGLALGASGMPARADLSTADRVNNETVISANGTATGPVSSVGPSTTNVLSNFSGILTTLAVDNVANGVVMSAVTSAFPTSTTGSLVGHTGGSPAAVSGGSSVSTSGSPGSTRSPVSGSLTGAAATVPEPPSPLPLLSALMGLAGLSMVRRYWRT